MYIRIRIHALVGIQLFAGEFKPSSGFDDEPCPAGVCAHPGLQEKPRLHFDHFVPAMLTAFTILTGEWSESMLAGTRALGPLAIIYYVTVLLIGRSVIMNLLIAIVVYSLSV